MSATTEVTWEAIGEQALWIADVLMESTAQLDRMSEQLNRLIVQAADLPAPEGGEERKREVIKIWRATLAQVDRMRMAMTVTQ